LHPNQIISYYPTYSLLDQVLSKGYKNVNLFIDFKNCAQTLYQKHCIDTLLENSTISKFIDSSIFTAAIAFLAFHKLYAIKRKIDMKFYIFFELGQSYYHQNINSKYKVSRRINDLFGLDYESKEKFNNIVKNNLLLIDKVFNKINKINVIKLEHLEADFIPYYLIRNELVEKENTANIIYSSDHDLKQTIIDENCFIFSKAHKIKKIISKNEVMSAELKQDSDIPDEYLPLYMSIVGDTGDDIKGVKGIGPQTFIKTFPQIQALICNNMELLYNNIMEKKNIFNINSSEASDPNIRKILLEEETNSTISNNMKLISFEILTRSLNNPNTTDMLQRREQIINTLKTKKYPKEPIVKALEMNKIFLETEDIETLFFEQSI
jgi:hypothetical protein